uniref:Putative mumet1 n=1 Tax=Ixodes ricinus TaxID=34613 RepID=A0A131XS24_IXORI
MEKGKQFSSFAELATAIAEFQDTNFVQFWINSSRTIAGARKKGVKRHINEDLVYTEITYSCTHGGRKYKSQSTGARPNQRTYRIGCTAMIRAVASKDGKHLVITVMDNEHQHPVSEACYRQFPKQRRLAGDPRRGARRVLALMANKTVDGTGNILRLSNHNTKTAMTLEQLQGPALDAIAAQVRSTGGTMEVLVTMDNAVVGVFYQDEEMKSTFANYAEVLFVDAVRRTGEKRTPLHVVATEDSNGEAQVVALLLCVEEDEETVRAVFQRLWVHCDQTDKTQTIVTDRDCIVRKVLGEIFPSAEQIICPFYVLQSFKRDVTMDKMGISSQQRAHLLKILRSMCFANDEEDYGKKLEALEATLCPKVLDYFLSNWHDVRAEWVQGLQQTTRLGNRTTNRVESVNQKITMAVLRYESLPQLFEDLMVVTMGLRIERDQRATAVLMKTSTIPNSTEDELNFCKLLTPYAFKGVSQQLNAAKTMTTVEDPTASCESCTCRFARSVQLPCRHIFFLRKQNGFPLFFTKGVAARWTRDYYQQACRLFADSDEVSASVEMCDISVTGGRTLSQVQKYREVSTLLLQVSARIAGLAMTKYERYLDVIKQLRDAVEKGQDVCLADSEPDSKALLPW